MSCFFLLVCCLVHNMFRMENLVLDGMAAEPETCMAFGLLDESSRGVSGIPQVLLLIASAIEKSILKNEKLSNASTKDAITIFHGSRSPSLSIKQYIERIFKYSGCSTSCFVFAYIYISKFLRLTDGHLTSLNAHRLLITSIMVAAKFLDDEISTKSNYGRHATYLSEQLAWFIDVMVPMSNPRCYDNAYYARIGGISTGEMNRMEMRFLFNLDFRLQVTAEAFLNCCVKLGNESGRYTDGRLQEQDQGESTHPSSKQEELGMKPSTLLQIEM
ncbi:hypothetical protein SADUNF_Sadunf05G0019200 [Salix dunnii]|uniref:Cyclin n=1 Tax=Salix dunnii TaxID=1413687 RepID=A0A835MY69_9ROSI|nr:hypothetical protein SADUNF_Sadunf05G0019200 [Salix dunnii]